MIVAAANNHLQGVATRIICSTITDDGGNEQPVSISAIVAPGLGIKQFSVTSEMLKGFATHFRPSNLRLAIGGIVLPMQQLGIEETAGEMLFSTEVHLRT